MEDYFNMSLNIKLCFGKHAGAFRSKRYWLYLQNCHTLDLETLDWLPIYFNIRWVLLSVRHCFKHFPCRDSLNPYRNPIEQLLFNGILQIKTKQQLQTETQSKQLTQYPHPHPRSHREKNLNSSSLHLVPYSQASFS